MSKRVFYRLIWVPSLLILMALAIVFAQQPLALPKIGKMVPFTAGDKSITVLHPDNWKPEESASAGIMHQVRFAPSGNLRVSITTDLQGSLMADIARSSNNMLGSLSGMGGASAPQKSPLEVVHEQQGKEMEKKYKEFADGATTKAQVGGQEALITDFTYKNEDGRAMAGKRVTALSGDRRLTVTCHCLKEMRAIVFPVFDEMILSLRMGQEGG